MDNIPGAPTDQHRLPAYLFFAPAILLATISILVYMGFQFIAGDALDRVTTGSLAELEAQVSQIASQIVTEAVRVIEPLPRRKQEPVKKKAPVALGQPVTLLEFTGQEQATYLQAASSPDMKSTFVIDTSSPVSARLSVAVGEKAAAKSFGSGRIKLPKPAAVEGKRAFSMSIKGSQLKAVHIAALEQRGDQYLIWEKHGVQPGADWATVTIPFADCDMWLYDMKTRQYSRPSVFSEPVNIGGFRALVQPWQVAGSAATLWIGGISLR